jgi:hypothetical protein
MQRRTNCRMRASANRAEALCPVDLTHLCLKYNSCLVQGESWMVEFKGFWNDPEIASFIKRELLSFSPNITALDTLLCSLN